jgi:hypothetical protein
MNNFWTGQWIPLEEKIQFLPRQVSPAVSTVQADSIPFMEHSQKKEAKSMTVALEDKVLWSIKETAARLGSSERTLHEYTAPKLPEVRELASSRITVNLSDSPRHVLVPFANWSGVFRSRWSLPG